MDARELQWMVGLRVRIDAGLEGYGVSMLVVAVLESKEGVLVVDLTGLVAIIDENSEITVKLGSITPYFVKMLPGPQWLVMHRFEGDIRFNENFRADSLAAESYRDWMNDEEKRRVESAGANN